MQENAISTHPKLVITNYKQFKAKTEIILAPITILVGPNGGGKSSIISAIRLFSLSVRYLYNGDELAKSEIGKILFDMVVAAGSSNKRNFTLSYFEGDREWMKIEYKRGHKGELRIDNFIQDIRFKVNNDGSQEELCFKIKVFINEFVRYNAEEIDRLEDDFKESLSEYAKKLRLFRKLLPDNNKYLRLVKTSVVDKFDNNYESEWRDFLTRLASVFYSRLFKISPIYNDSYYFESFFYWAIIFLSTEEENKNTLLANNSKIYELINSVFNFFEAEREEWMNLIYYRLDDTRKDPPEYFEVKDEKVINDYYDLCSYLLSIEKTKSWKLQQSQDLNYWLKKFEIAEGLCLSKPIQLKPDHVFYSILLHNNGIEFDLNSLSSGGKQILPIILELMTSEGNLQKTIISQPELHLHPKLQAEIADLLISIVFKIRTLDGNLESNFDNPNNSIVVETHSEHIIRKIQLLVARREANCEHIALYYIKPDHSSQTSKAIFLPINEKGLFEKKWPDGFFGEATILTLDLIEELSRRQN